jgi:hypothetical protein
MFILHIPTAKRNEFDSCLACLCRLSHYYYFIMVTTTINGWNIIIIIIIIVIVIVINYLPNQHANQGKRFIKNLVGNYLLHEKGP